MEDYHAWLDKYAHNSFPKIEGWVDPRIFWESLTKRLHYT